ncbi:MAG TPA: DUF4340 domain-containing protein [Planctomycetota bacterium]|nr:DUF4340 domain-containing protein [Planctomycetota bacterium]
MNSRTIQIMAVVALAVAGAAWYSSRPAKPASAQQSQVGVELFPGLAKKAAEVQTVKVQAKGQSFTLDKQGDAWGMSDKGGYAVNFDKVKDLVSKLAYFKIVEKKTADPERFAKLDLEDADKPESKSTRVTLSDKAGSVLADILIGKSATGGGPNLASMYVRRPGENQTYEVSGTVYIDGAANNWLDKQIVKLERARVHKVESLTSDGSKLVISKATPDDKNFAVADVPAGAELKWPGVADGVAGALEYMNFDDVEPAGTRDFTDPSTATTTLQTFDGLLVTVKVLEKEGKFYGQFSAKADPAARVEVTKFEPPPPAPTPAPTDPAAPPAPIDPNAPAPAAPAPIETKSVPGKTAEEVAKEASELDARLSKWTFVLPGYAASNFTKKMSDMLKEPEPPAVPGSPLLDPTAPTVPPVDDGATKQPDQPIDDGHGHDLPKSPVDDGAAKEPKSPVDDGGVKEPKKPDDGK